MLLTTETVPVFSTMREFLHIHKTRPNSVAGKSTISQLIQLLANETGLIIRSLECLLEYTSPCREQGEGGW